MKAGQPRCAAVQRSSMRPQPRMARVVPSATRSFVVHTDLDAPNFTLSVHSGEDGVARELCETVEKAAAAAIASRGSFALAVPGGSVLKMLGGLAHSRGIDWSKVYLAYVNHKVVPLADKSSTHQKARDLFLDKVGMPKANVIAPHGDGRSAAEEAASYESRLAELAQKLGLVTVVGGVPRMDLVLLGMGSDGHVGSLYPGKPEPLAKAGLVLPVVKAEGAASITFTLPVMNAARHTLVALTGGKKADAVRRALQERMPPGDFPAQMVRPTPGGLTWVLDAGAASDLDVVRGSKALIF